jgi:hypothetical protein
LAASFAAFFAAARFSALLAMLHQPDDGEREREGADADHAHFQDRGASLARGVLLLL